MIRWKGNKQRPTTRYPDMEIMRQGFQSAISTMLHEIMVNNFEINRMTEVTSREIKIIKKNQKEIWEKINLLKLKIHWMGSINIRGQNSVREFKGRSIRSSNLKNRGQLLKKKNTDSQGAVRLWGNIIRSKMCVIKVSEHQKKTLV